MASFPPRERVVDAWAPRPIQTFQGSVTARPLSLSADPRQRKGKEAGRAYHSL